MSAHERAVGIGALEQWRRELTAKLRTTATVDALWRAAAYEAAAYDALHQGSAAAADRLFRKAADVYLAARVGRRGAA